MKKSKFIMIGNICGLFGGAGLIYSAVTDGNIPKIIYFVIAVCEFILTISIIYNCFYFNRNKK